MVNCENYKGLSLNDFINLPASCTIHKNIYSIKINKIVNELSKYLEITFIEYRNVYYSNESKSFNPSKVERKNTLIIFDNLNVYQRALTGKLYPATLSSLSSIASRDKSLFLSFFNCFYKYLSTLNNLFKDIYRESCNNIIFLPIQVNKIWLASNKVDLLKMSFKNIEIPKSLGKFKLQESYILLKCKKYVNDNEWQKLYLIKDNLNFKTKTSSIEQIKECFLIYYTLKIGELNLNDSELSYIYDYINMIITYSKAKKINLNLNSVKSIIKAHNEAIEEMYKKETPIIRIRKDTKFKNLNLGPDFELISTRKRILKETEIQKHCVWSRADDINKDRCMIYSTIYENSRYTVDIRKNNGNFYIYEIKGVLNKEALDKLIEIINFKLKNNKSVD